MKKSNAVLGILTIFCLVWATGGSAWSYMASFNDNYQGGLTPSGYGDVVGDPGVFDLQRLVYTSNGIQNTIQIVGNYFNTTGNRLGTLLGDLFISTSGWHPYGTAPYAGDTMNNGETWELAVVLDTRDFSKTSGNLNLYDVSSGAISPSYFGTYSPSHYRSQQEFSFNGSSNPLATGTWGISGNTLTLNFNYDLSGSQDLGFHWAMSCANDVIEGGVHVPEPATLLFLGTGLIGLAGLARRKM